MSLYDDMAAIALDLLAEFGAEATLIQRGDPVYDETQGKAIPTLTNKTVRLVFKTQSEASKKDSSSSANRKEAIISGTDTDGAAVTINVSDNIRVGVSIYKIIDPGPVAPAGTPVVYDAVMEA